MRHPRHLKLFATGLLGVLIITGMTPTGASSANISHSYHASGAVNNGDLVSLDRQHSDYVQLADTTSGPRLLGVIVAANDSLLAVNPTEGNVQVATSGNVTTLVSTLNGDINVGDQIAVSPFKGLGMKAQSGSYVVGLAQTGFNARSQGATSESVTDKSGKTTRVAVGYVGLNIAIGLDNTSGGQNQLSSLQKLAKSLTGHTVSTIRIVISIMVAVVALIALITLVYASIYGSIISIGRNPLAKYAIFRTLGSVMGMAVLTAGLAAITIFLLLR
jgi:hypothetical protein